MDSQVLAVTSTTQEGQQRFEVRRPNKTINIQGIHPHAFQEETEAFEGISAQADGAYVPPTAILGNL